MKEYKIGHYYKRVNENGDYFIFKVLSYDISWGVSIEPVGEIPAWVDCNYSSISTCTAKICHYTFVSIRYSYFDVEAREDEVTLELLE